MSSRPSDPRGISRIPRPTPATALVPDTSSKRQRHPSPSTSLSSIASLEGDFCPKKPCAKSARLCETPIPKPRSLSSLPRSSVAPEPTHYPSTEPLTTDPPIADTNDDGFTTVQSRKTRSRPSQLGNGPPLERRPTAPRQAPHPSVSVARPPPLLSPFPAFRVMPQEGFQTSYDAVAYLEDIVQGLKVRNLIGKDGSSVLVPLDESTFNTLNSMASDTSAQVTITKIEPQTQVKKGIVMGYPLRMPLSILLNHPQVEEATRCQSTRGQMDTRQVLVTLRGDLPPSLTLGNWGTFYLRPYVPEPLRCYRCQRFGHHQAACERPMVCGMCSGPHTTSICLTKYKAKQEIRHKCPNCSGSHHAWNPNCPVRLQLVNRGRERQAAWVEEQQKITPAPPGTFVWGQQRQPPLQTPAAPQLMSEEFPPLPLATATVIPQPLPPVTPCITSSPAPPPQNTAIPTPLHQTALGVAPSHVPTPLEDPTPTPCVAPSPVPSPPSTTQPFPPGSFLLTATELKTFARELAMGLTQVIAVSLGTQVNMEALANVIDKATEKAVERFTEAAKMNPQNSGPIPQTTPQEVARVQTKAHRGKLLSSSQPQMKSKAKSRHKQKASPSVSGTV